ncbi:MAG: pilin [Candidatus Komeilibacteria bacterium]
MKKIFFTLLTLLLLPAAANAVEEIPPVVLPNPLGQEVNNIPLLVNHIIVGILGIVGAVALLAFIWGGLLWMTSLGNADRVKQGKETLIYATIGLLVIFISYSVINFIFKSLT